MITFYIYSLLAGMFAAVGVPHFVKGITGESHQTPFGRPSSAIVNVIWGWSNFVLAALMVHFAHPWGHIYRACALFALGVLAMALILANLWSMYPMNGAQSKRPKD